ncbi:MAG: type II toxin-antitoxin system RelE/ParE family toxin [Spirochaetes bacterium]|nr:type II toxin-antitoxin system RelE/ParE family toxin [Spirochaetota bacterium]
MYALHITDIAEQDILLTVKYISDVLKSPKAANNLLDEIEKYEEIIQNTPHIYPFVSDEYFTENRFKFVMIKNYIMFYIINEDEKRVYVIRFLHARRNWKGILTNCID